MVNADLSPLAKELRYIGCRRKSRPIVAFPCFIHPRNGHPKE